MSPYMFLLVADVLQTLIKQDGGVGQPLIASSCVVMQYADDTLIVYRGNPEEVTRMRELLDQFAEATSLWINYNKSTAVPMNMSSDAISQCIAALGCRQEGFPQTYLGLPLSNEKLRSATFDPYISKADRYLAGWQAQLLNPTGRSVLINSVLDSQLIYLMCAIKLPAGVREQIDRRRRAFLWAMDGRGQSEWSNLPGGLGPSLQHHRCGGTWHTSPGYTEHMPADQARPPATPGYGILLGKVGQAAYGLGDNGR